MTQNLSIGVAQYSHVHLPGAKHWVIVIITDCSKLKGVAFQITGSTNTYKVKQPEEVELLHLNNYMGSVSVGTVHSDYAFGAEGTIVQHTPVVRGNLNWNCRNWVVAALKCLKDAQYGISEVSVEELQAQFTQVQREEM
jgi:hypothetical protein